MRGSLIGESPWFQLFIIFLIALGGTLVFLMLGVLLLPLFFPVALEDMMTILQEPGNAGATEILKFLQGFNTIGTFLIPGLFGAYLISRHPSDYLQINDFPARWPLTIGLVVILTLCGTVISDALYRFSSEVLIPDYLSGLQAYVQESEEMITQQLKGFLRMENFLDFAKVFVVMALLPAVCEETLFRGVVQPLFIKGFRNVHVGILVTSIVFGFLHWQFNSLLSIIALSMVLGYLKVWSKSLWVPVLMHLINNGSIVVAVYFFDMPMDDINAASTEWQDVYFWPGIVTFGLCLGALWYFLVKNKGLPEPRS